MAQTSKGKLITFEGSEGCGKSTQVALLAKALESAGNEVIVLREPGGTHIGERLRHLLKHDAEALHMCPETELLLFTASRAQLVREVIRPALAEGKYIICDRFLDSTTVYQGMARHLSREIVESINTLAVGETLPDLTIILDLSAQTGLQRVHYRPGNEPDRMEQEDLAFYESVRNGYLTLATESPEENRFFIVDAGDSMESVHQKILGELTRRFGA